MGRGAATKWLGAGRAPDIGLTVGGWYMLTVLLPMRAAPGRETEAIRYCGTGRCVTLCMKSGRGP